MLHFKDHKFFFYFNIVNDNIKININQPDHCGLNSVSTSTPQNANKILYLGHLSQYFMLPFKEKSNHLK